MVVRRILAGALLAPLLLLSACGGDDTSVADPPVSPTSSSTSAADPPHRESAKAFIRRFASVEQEMENTGRIGLYTTLTRTCRECQDLAKQIRRFYSSGGYVRWAGWTIKSIRPYGSSNGDSSYAIEVVSAPTRYRESKNGAVKRLAGGPATEIVTLGRDGGSWVVTGRSKVAS